MQHYLNKSQTLEESEQNVQDLLSIIWLLVWQFPEHIAIIPEESLVKLDKNGSTFTVWEDLPTKDLKIQAHKS